MIAIVILNIALMGFVLLVIVGGLGASLRSEGNLSFATRRRRWVRARQGFTRKPALQS